MFQTIQKIVAILSGYENGKLLAPRKKSRLGGKGRVKDLVSISDEARQRCNSGDDEAIPRHNEKMYKK